MEEITALHHRFGAIGVGLDYAVSPDIPEGWTVIVRCWDQARSGSWDALIEPPAPKIGWRLADPFAESRDEAVQRAVAEIRSHLAARSRA